MRSNILNSFPINSGLVASLVLLTGGMAMAQSAVTLTAGPTSATLPDGQTVPMWGYSCGATPTNATCTATNGAAQTGATWQPPLITVPSGQPLTITLINNLTFATTGAPNNIPTSLVIDGQLGGGLGTNRTTTTSPTHAPQGTTWPGTLGTTNPGDPVFTPAPQPDRVRSFATEVPAGATTALTWSNLRPGTYLIHSGTHPSIQHPMGLYGVLVVTEPDTATIPSAHQAYGTTFDKDVALLLSEIDPVQNKSVDTAVRTYGFSATKVWNGRPGECGDVPPSATADTTTANTCYPPAVNYTPLYSLINGVSFDRTKPGASALTVPAAAAQARVLLRFVNAGLRMHVPSVVGTSMTLLAEDGNKLPGAAKVQSEVFLAAGKTYDVTIQPAQVAPATTPATYAPATYAVYDRALSLSIGGQRDGGMQAFINVAGGAPAGTPSTTAKANPDTYYVVNGIPLAVSDPAKGVIANDVGIYGVAVSGAAPAGLTFNANGTFTYTGAPTTFTYCGNGATVGDACATVTLADCAVSGTCLAAAPVAGNVAFTSNIATRYASSPPGVLGSNVINPSGLPLTALASGAAAGGTVTLYDNGSFVATKTGAGVACPAFASAPAGATCVTFGYQARNSQGTTSAASTPNAAVVFLPASNVTVNVRDALNGVLIADYRWIIEEDRTFSVDPKCQINSTDPSVRPSTCPPLPVESLGYSFHVSSMPVVAQGCVGATSCEGGQTVQGAPATCDIGNGACRATSDPSGVGIVVDPAAGQKVAVNPNSVHLDPTKRYYISILPGDGVNPTIGGAGGAMQVNPNCATDCALRQFDIAKDCGPYNPGDPRWQPGNLGDANGNNTALCGHAMGGASIAAGQTALEIRLQQTPLPTAKIAVLVFEDDYPVNGEQDVGGSPGTTLAPNEPGLGGFELKLFDQAGALGDSTGQLTYDQFNEPVSNSLAGTIDPVTGLDACPITKRTDGLVGMIPTCPKFEADGVTWSPLAGQAVIANLYPGLYEVVATPAADRIARGEEWLQTNTLDGTKPHEAFIKPNEPAYFQEFGPGGYHVAIGFANPQIINNRRHNSAGTGICDPAPAGGGLTCNATLNVQVSSARMSRTPDQRIYSSSGGPTDPAAYAAYGFTQCYLALGAPDAADFAFGKCDPDGKVTFTDIPKGDWKLTIFDQWNEIIVDGLVQPVRVDGDTAPKLFAAMQWRSNIYTRTFIDSNGDGVSQAEEPGLALVNTNIRYRDGSIGFFNNTDLNGYAGFNEVFPFMNWLVVETSSTRFKPTGTHVVYDAGGPADGTPGGASSTIADHLANTIERVSLPLNQRVPGAVYCADADCTNASIATGAGNATGTCTTDPTTGIQTCTGLSTGRIDPPQAWGNTEGWQGLLGQNSFVEFGVKSFDSGENGGITGQVIYASTRPFDDPTLLLQLSWEPGVARVKVNLYQKTVDPQYGTERLKLVDTTTTASWDDWAQGFHLAADGVTKIPNMNCPGQDPTSPFFATLKDSKQWLDAASPKTSLPNHALFKCYDGWSMLNQVQPAPYDGMYRFPSVTGVSPTTGKPTGSNCDPTVCVDNPSGDGTKMLPPGKYVVELIVPAGYELVKEEDKNILLGDVYIAPVTQQFAGFGNVFIMPDQAAINAYYNKNSPGGLNLTTNLGAAPRHEGDTGSVEAFWPCVGQKRIVPDLNSLYPGAGQAAPFAGASRNLCDRKEVILDDQASVLAKFYVFSSTHVAGHFTGTITNDFASEFDPFSPQFGEKFGPPNLPVAMRDFSGNEVSRTYSDQWGLFNGLYFSTYGVNPPNPTGYVPQMSLACMNDSGPILDTRAGSPTLGQMITDPAYNPAYSNFCYEWPFMPGTTSYMDTPVIPTMAFADGYNLADCEYPDATPAIKSVLGDTFGPSSGRGPWVSTSGGGHTLTITARGDNDVQNPAFSGPGAATAPYNQKTVKRHYGFGGTAGTVALVGSDGVSRPLTGVSWSDTTITGTVPANVPLCNANNPSYRGANATARCGELVITAANGKRSIDTVTVTIGGTTPIYVTPASLSTTTFGQTFPNPLQTAIDAASPGAMIILGPGVYRENLLMWKPVRLQGVGAGSVTINADAHPAGKMDPWRRQVVCLFGLSLAGRPLITDGTFPPDPYDPSGTYTCPARMRLRVDRLPVEAVVGWDVAGNGNLAEQLQEPTIMGAYEGAGITVLGRGIRLPPGSTDFWGAGNEGIFPAGYSYLSTSTADCASSTTRTDGFDYGTSNFLCNPSRIDGLSVINSSQGGGAIFAHAWNHNLEVANTRVWGNHGTLTGGITIGQGEFPDAYIVGDANNPPVANQPAGGLIDGQQAGYGFNRGVKVHHNSVTDNASIGDALYSGTPSAAGGVSFSAGADNYQFNHNWVCGNLSTGDGGGVAHVGYINDGNISNNFILYNQSSDATLPTNGGGLVIIGGAPDRQTTLPDGTVVECGTTTDVDCPPGLSAGTGRNLVIDSNLLIGNSAESGSGGGIRFQGVNGQEVIAFPTMPFFWHGVNVTNNIIANNVAGWDGGGVSMQDALKLNFINNTVVSNDTTASAGVLFKTIGSALASSPPPGCNPGSDPNASCYGPNAPVNDQPAGLVTMQHSPNLIAALPPPGPGLASGVNCPMIATLIANTYSAVDDGDCRTYSKPVLLNNLFWQNRAFHIQIVGPGSGLQSQQNLVTLTPTLNQTATGQCVSGATYWDVGFRGDTSSTNPANIFGGPANPTLRLNNSILTSFSGGRYSGNGNLAPGTSPVRSVICNGSRLPPENGGHGYNAPPGQSETTGLHQVFTVNNIRPDATVDEGQNWINLQYGPLALFNVAGQAMVANGLAGPTLGAYSIPGNSAAVNAGNPMPFVAPDHDFFGQGRGPASGNGRVDIGAVEFSTPLGPVPVVTPASLAFGSVVVGQTSPTQNLTLTNNGGAAFVISSIPVTPPFSRNTGGTFPAGAPNCGVALPAGASCTIKVQYTAPAPAGTVSSGTVTINGNAGVTNSPVSLTGNSVAATGLAAAP